MGTTILSFSDRIVIETLRHEKRSLRYIADYLGFSKTTIFNEIHRLKGEYHATSAQADHETKLSYRGRKCSLTANLKRLIEDKIKIQKWSIEQVAHVVRIAYKTIYNWVVSVLKKPVGLSVMVVRLKIVQLKLLIVILQAILKLIQFYLASAKVKQ